MNPAARASASGLSADFLEEPAELDPRTREQRRKLTLIGAIFAVLFVLAAVVPIGGAVVGSGQVGIASKVKRVAHPTGGVIAQIAVANGQHVRAGQLLMRLDDRVTGADARYSSQTVEQLLAQRGRLEAEQVGAPAIRFPPELLADAGPSARQAMADESRLFALRASESAQIRAQLAARVQQYSDQIAGYRAQIASLQRQRELIEPERKSTQELAEKQLVTISRVNELERTAAELDGNIASLHAQIAAAQAQIAEAQEQSVQVLQSRRADAGKQLADVNTALNQQQLRSVAASDQHTRSEIRAPYSGTVEKIAFAAVGDVVKPAEPIMEIVPDADQLVIEAMVSPNDVDQVQIGQSATVRFPSFNRAATPQIDGRVSYVATDRTENPDNKQSYFVARIAIDQRALRRLGLNLRSGIPAEVHIQTGDRSLLSYLFKPLSDQFARAFRDS
jgi:HlyD family type I secretion membrane fusion protein